VAAVSANENRPSVAAAALRELTAAYVLLERVADRAEDWSSPGYKPDAGERVEMRQELEQLAAWRQTHAQLAAWARRTGKPAAARVLRLIP
jgi:hypothetical protein